MFALTRPLLSVLPVGLTVVPVGGLLREKLTVTPGAGLLLESTTLKVTVACSLNPEPRIPMIVQSTPPHLVDTQAIAWMARIGRFSVATELVGACWATM